MLGDGVWCFGGSAMMVHILQADGIGLFLCVDGLFAARVAYFF